jgi:hypothetical protein
MLENIYNQKVTILNKLRREDNDKHTDLWFKHTIDNVVWYTDSARSAGAHDVFIGSYITILIPFNESYRNYADWKTLTNKDDYFTVSVGDYIIMGDVEEDVNANNIVKVTQKYGEDVCLVRHHNENHNRFGARVQLKIQGV